jgi:hypothetical protein
MFLEKPIVRLSHLLPIQKNSKPISKNVNFGLLIHFHMGINLKDSDRSYLV